MYNVVNKWKFYQIWTCPILFHFTLLVCTRFFNEIERCQSLWKSLKYFSVLWPMTNDVKFEYVPWSSICFCLFLLFVFTFVIKLKNFDFGSYWNTLIFFDKKWCGVRFEYIPWSNVWFCFISMHGYTLVKKLRNFDFESHW